MKRKSESSFVKTELKERDRFLRVLKLKKVDRPPVIGIIQSATVEIMESLDIYYRDAYRDPEKMASLASASWTQLGLEAVGVPFCQTVEVEVFGLEIYWGRKKTDIPTVASFKGCMSPEGIEVPENFLEKGRIPVVLEAIEILKERVGDDIPVIGQIIGPFSLAAHLANMEKILKMSVKKPKLVEEFTMLGLDFLVEYANAMLERGADAILVANMFASVDLLGASGYVKHAQPFDKKLIRRIKGPVILHICGDGTKIVRDMIDTGADCISIDSKTDARYAVEVSRGKAAIMGNIDTIYTLVFGKPRDVIVETKKALESGIDIIAPECSLSPNTPNVNVKAMVQTVKNLSEE